MTDNEPYEISCNEAVPGANGTPSEEEGTSKTMLSAITALAAVMYAM